MLANATSTRTVGQPLARDLFACFSRMENDAHAQTIAHEQSRPDDPTSRDFARLGARDGWSIGNCSAELAHANGAGVSVLQQHELKTFAEEIDECAFVLHGTFTNVQVGVPEGTTDLNVMTVIKDHEKVAGRKVVVIPKELPALADPKKSTPPEFIMFGQIINEQIVPVRIIEVNDKDLVPYFVESAKQWKSKQAV